jgi:hypothetical protein
MELPRGLELVKYWGPENLSRLNLSKSIEPLNLDRNFYLCVFLFGVYVLCNPVTIPYA